MTTVQHYTGKQIEENRQRFREKQRERRKEGWQTEVMQGQHVRQTIDFATQSSWQWLRRGSLKRQTESQIIAAQDQGSGTNFRKSKIEHSRVCRMCKARDETVTHIISECSKLAQTDYKARHDSMSSAVLPHKKS